MRNLKIAGIIAVAILLPLLHAKQADQQPDILLIMPDQWRGDALSILGCAGVTTPQLDQLAREGALFRRAYATRALLHSCTLRLPYRTFPSDQRSGRPLNPGTLRK